MEGSRNPPRWRRQQALGDAKCWWDGSDADGDQKCERKADEDINSDDEFGRLVSITALGSSETLAMNK